jgi:5-formyltetrahydrofolate cyclo-ligase
VVNAAKAALRAKVLAQRDAVDETSRQQQQAAVLDRILELPEWREAGTLMVYLGIRTELDPVPLAEAVLASGRRLVLPRILRGQGTLEIREVHDLDTDLVPGVWGLREPDPQRCPEVPVGDLDFILVPGVAFDRDGGRMGYGAGYYDRMLAHEDQRATLAAALFEVQLVEAVPREAHDLPVELLVLPDRLIRVTPAVRYAHRRR